MLLRFVALVSLGIFAAHVALGQAGRRPPPVPSQTPEEQERVFTEEVRLPIFATNERGDFDPALEREEVLVLEDGVPQEVRSVRRLPASILLLIDTGGELNPAVRTSTTRAIALNMLGNLREGDQVAVIQFNSRVDVLQDWTTERDRATRVVKTKLLSGNGSRLSQAIIKASSLLQAQPLGNRHLVIITSGVETTGRMNYKEALIALRGDTPEQRAQQTQAVKQLNAAQSTVHIISYAQAGQTLVNKRKKEDITVGVAQGGGISTVGIDPTLPPGTSRGGALNSPRTGVSIRFDPQMAKLRKVYEQASNRNEQRLKTFAEETGGRIWLAATPVEMVAQGGAVAREIGAQYVLTYRPKRPLATAPPTEYRRIVVSPRRIGLILRSRRGYVVASQR